MRNSTLVRHLAVLGAGALLLGTPATAAAAQSVEEFPGSVGNLAGGALAAAGSGDLGSTVAGGNCVAVDPALGSVATNPLKVEMTTKEGESGVAATDFSGGAMMAATTGTLHWTNTTTGEKGAQDFGPFSFDRLGDYHDIPTGVGHVEWTVDANESAVPLSVAVPLSAVGINGGPGSSAPYTTCEGTVEIA
ncbi:hypothetical protein [Dietzia sp.]|uniref:hypothetical protein n=1 Tax=Dietzia sp. TaxID=1871616 RepID=UPI002FD91245